MKVINLIKKRSKKHFGGIIPVLILFFVSITINAQNRIITIPQKQMTILSAFEEIEKQTNLKIAYNEKAIDVNKRILINIPGKPLSEALSAILKDTDMTFKIEGKQIMIVPAAGPDLARNYTGTVTDAKGEPIIGASVVEKGTNNGIATDSEGKFNLSVRPGAVLVFSYLGYITKEVSAGAQNTIQVSLSEDTRMIDEVVVIGYGAQKKANLTGSVGYIDSKQIENRAVYTLTQALQGKVAGLNISSSSGMPGAPQNINIRGYTGLGQMAAPLLVIDGVQGGNISDIEMNDVESISFLKDAASSAIYGSSAPYGVILVTTKKGHEGKPVITYNNNFGFSTPTNLPHYANSLDFANQFNQAIVNGNQSALAYNLDVVERIKQYMAGTLKEETQKDPTKDDWLTFFAANGNNEWFDLYFKKSSFSQHHNIGISGASQSSNYFIGLGYTQQDGMFNFANEKDQRYNARVNVSSNLTKWLTFNARTSYSQTHQNMPAQYESIYGGNVATVDYSYQMLHSIGRTFPTVPLRDPSGHLSEFSYALGWAEGGRQNRLTDNFSLTGEFVVKPLPGWDITANYTCSGRNYEHKNHAATFYTMRPSGVLVPRSGSDVNSLYRNFEKNRNFVINAYTTYQKTIGDHHFSGTLGFVQELGNYLKMSGSNTYLLTDEVPMLSLTYGTNIALSDAAWEEASRGTFGRVMYNYKEKYLLELNGRYDGTSKYLKDYRMKFYPGISAGWIVSRESFWEPLANKVNQFKLRANYASLGNQLYSSRYGFYPGLGYNLSTNTQWIFPGDTRQMSFSAPPLVDYSLTWVTTSTLGFGLDLGLLKNRLEFTYDWYRRIEKDFLGPAQDFPAILGTSAPTQNNTDTEVKGYDITIGWRDKIGDFTYGANLILNDYRGKVIKYPSSSKLITGWYNGKTMGEIWGFETVGLIKTQAEADECVKTQQLLNSNWYIGDVHYKNNGDVLTYGKNTIDDPGDRKVIGNATPRYAFGLTLNGGWKNFDAQVFFQGIGKRDIMFRENTNYFWGITSWGMWQSSVYTVHDRFHIKNPNAQYDFLPDNPNGYLPNGYFNSNYKNTWAQSRYLQNGAYMRLKNLQLGYTIPQSLTEKINCQKARIFVNGENVFTFTKLISIVDPEIVDINRGENNMSTGKVYPLRRTWSFGINVTF